MDLSIVILISGRGSNMTAILDRLERENWPIRVSAVLSNRPDAQGLAHAQARGLPTVIVDHAAHQTRESFDAALGNAIDRFAPDTIVLAGFMRILTAAFCERYAGRLLNVHPSLLPSYTGLDTHARALADGVKFHGLTIHGVTPSLDQGPILAQAVVPVLEGDTPEGLASRVLEMEHRVYPEAVAAVVAGLVRWTPLGWVSGAPRPGFESLRFRPWHVHPELQH